MRAWPSCEDWREQRSRKSLQRGEWIAVSSAVVCHPGSTDRLLCVFRPSADPAEDNIKSVDNKVFICPERPGWINNRNFGYGYNFQFLGNAAPNPAEASSTSRLSPPGFSQRDRHLGRLLARPRGKAPGSRTGYRADGASDLFALGKPWLVARSAPPDPGTSDFCDDSNRDPQHRGGPEARHDGKSVALFADSHAERLTPRQMGYSVKPDGRFDIGGDGANNRLFSGTGRDDDPPSVH